MCIVLSLIEQRLLLLLPNAIPLMHIQVRGGLTTFKAGSITGNSQEYQKWNHRALLVMALGQTVANHGPRKGF